MDSEARESRFQRLYSAHSEEVLRFAVRCGASRSDAEEVVEETFLVCWRRLDEVPDPELPWLRGVARYVLRNRRRSDHRRDALHRKLAHEKPDPPSPPSDNTAGREEVKKALTCLDEAEREVLALLVWEDLSHEEAGKILGCSRNAVTKRYLKARRKLEALLSPVRT